MSFVGHGSYKLHHDYAYLDEDDAIQQGVRILTVFLYLNDVEAGGGTSFPRLNLTVMPKRGRVLIWPSVLDSDPTMIDWNTEHEAKEVEKGEKYAANVWMHLKPYRIAYKKYQCCEKARKLIENGPVLWKAGDLDKMFRDMVANVWNKETYNPKVLSSPISYHDEQGNQTDGPWVVTMENFIALEEAQRLIELGALQGYERSEIGEEGSIDESLRSSSQSWCLDECREDKVVQSVVERIYNLTQIDEAYSEYMQMLKYDVGQL
jgi:hypothetical protein